MVRLEEIFESIPAKMQRGEPFVIYAKPGESKVSVVFSGRGAASDEPHFVFAPFFGQPLRIGTGSKFEFEAAGEVLQVTESSAGESGRSEFESLVATAKSEISYSKFSKVVLSRAETIEGSFDIARSFKKLLSYTNAFRYCWFHRDSGLWVGATPELLIKSSDRTFQTVALAGTRTQNSGDWPAKERDEQQIVTDYIASKARAVSKTVEVSAPFTVSAGNLSHIKSEISGMLKNGLSAEDLVRELHPTPAVCGFPTDAAREFILDNEGYDRRYYSGYLGEIERGRSEVYVNLRCMQLSESKATLYAGCGITAQSDPEKEYYETAAKMLTMKNIL